MSKGAGYGAGGPDQTTKQLQERLQQLGFHVPSDGQFGPQTEMAVKAFQQRYGLDPSGGVDAATVELLQAPPDQTLAQVRAAKAAVSKAASAAARKTATAKARATSTARTARVRRAAQAGSGGRSGASTRVRGVAPGTSTAVPGVGHLGAGMLNQGTGMQGKAVPAVSNLQAALTQAGYKLTKDGRFGPQTEAAVKQLQKDHGLTADGIVGPATKALLVGLGSSAGTTKTISRTQAQAQKPLPGEVATLRTQAPHPRHSSRTAGSRMQLKGPPSKPKKLKYSVDDVPDPDLEEGTWTGGNKTANTSTVAFGVGGEPSMSIKDFRSEGEPLADLPVWDREQKLANRPSYVIPDSRDFEPAPGIPRVPGDTMIDDQRERYDQVQGALNEAVAARRAARDGRTFARAYARERLLRAQLQEAESYKEALHPRGRGGKWVDVLAKLKALPVNKPGEIHRGVTAMRLSTGHYAAGTAGGGFHIHDEDPERVAKAIQGHLDQEAERRAHGERAVTGLSTEAAQHFTRDWALRGDPEGLPERHEMYHQVYSEDPKGFVRDVFSQQMTPASRAEAERALGAAKEREQLNRDRAATEVEKQKRRPIIQQMEAGRTRQAEVAEIMRKSRGAQAELERYTAVLHHPAHGTHELPVTAATPEGAQIAAELLGLGTVQSLKPSRRRKRR